MSYRRKKLLNVIRPLSGHFFGGFLTEKVFVKIHMVI